MKLPTQIQFCLNLLNGSGYSAYVVGGCVRDSLLGKSPADWDVCTGALPQEVESCFAGFKIIPTGLKHGTVTVLIEGTPVEITTFRSDGDYLDHRRPQEVSFTRSLNEDLARRDFTINAMAYHPVDGFVDQYGGQADLQAGIIRCVGDAAIRFTEDALRILRLFRFAAQLEFSIERETLQAASRCAGYLQHISGERISAELGKLLVAPRPGVVLQRMCATGVLQQIIPEFAPCVGFRQNTPYHNRTVDHHILAAVDAAPPILPVRLALLLHDIGKPLCYQPDAMGVGHFHGHAAQSARLAGEILERLRWDRRTTQRVTDLVEQHHLSIPAELVPLKRLISRLGEDFLRQLLQVRLADTSAKNPTAAARRLRALRDAHKTFDEILRVGPPLTLKDLAVNGGDLIRLGFPPGEKLGRALQILLDDVLEHPENNSRTVLLSTAENLLQATI